jgi:hypothetical protein
MASLIKPGMLFQAERLPYPGQGGLEATMSNYGIPDLEEMPRPRTTYVVCRDGSIQDHWDRERPIGWELLEDGDQWFYRVTQMNHKPKPLAVFSMGTTEDVPTGRGKIGSMVFCARPCAMPACAEISQQIDDGEEVSSKLDSIAKYSRDLAFAAAVCNDPVQTDALARFVEGRMSYAEMRGLCG